MAEIEAGFLGGIVLGLLLVLLLGIYLGWVFATSKRSKGISIREWLDGETNYWLAGPVNQQLFASYKRCLNREERLRKKSAHDRSCIAALGAFAFYIALALLWFSYHNDYARTPKKCHQSMTAWVYSRACHDQLATSHQTQLLLAAFKEGRANPPSLSREPHMAASTGTNSTMVALANLPAAAAASHNTTPLAPAAQSAPSAADLQASTSTPYLDDPKAQAATAESPAAVFGPVEEQYVERLPSAAPAAAPQVNTTCTWDEIPAALVAAATAAAPQVNTTCTWDEIPAALVAAATAAAPAAPSVAANTTCSLDEVPAAWAAAQAAAIAAAAPAANTTCTMNERPAALSAAPARRAPAPPAPKCLPHQPLLMVPAAPFTCPVTGCECEDCSNPAGLWAHKAAAMVAPVEQAVRDKLHALADSTVKAFKAAQKRMAKVAAKPAFVAARCVLNMLRPTIVEQLPLAAAAYIAQTVVAHTLQQWAQP